MDAVKKVIEEALYLQVVSGCTRPQAVLALIKHGRVPNGFCRSECADILGVNVSYHEELVEGVLRKLKSYLIQSKLRDKLEDMLNEEGERE